jgi:hypothetical protein
MQAHELVGPKHFGPHRLTDRDTRQDRTHPGRIPPGKLPQCSKHLFATETKESHDQRPETFPVRVSHRRFPEWRQPQQGGIHLWPGMKCSGWNDEQSLSGGSNLDADA